MEYLVIGASGAGWKGLPPEDTCAPNVCLLHGLGGVPGHCPNRGGDMCDMIDGMFSKPEIQV